MNFATSTPGPRALDRRGSVWSACDQLAAEGVKPTLSKIRPLHRGGSDTDVQADIQAWFAQLFKNHGEQADGLGLPKEVAALMRGLWDAAQASADAQLQAERDTLEARRQAWADENARAALDRDDAQARSVELDRSLAAETEKSTALARSVADLEARLAESQSELRQERSRSERLVEDMRLAEIRSAEAASRAREEASKQLAATRRDHAHELSIERSARAEEVHALGEQLRERAERYDSELKLAEERLRSVEKRLMLEQDAVRQSAAEWRRKAQEERDAGETRVGLVRRQMEELLAKAAGLEASLVESRASAEDARRSAARAQASLSELAQAVARSAAHSQPQGPASGP